MASAIERAKALILAAGADPAEIDRAESFDDLVLLSAQLTSRPPGHGLSAAELAERAGTTHERVDRIRANVGLPTDPDDPWPWFESDVDWIRTVDAAFTVFGESAVEALMRRVGWSASQLAHAGSAVFRVNVVPEAQPGDSDELAFVERNLAAAPLMDGYVEAVGQLLRHHARFTFRTGTVAAGRFGELVSMAVGFVDLTSSTELGGRLSADQLAALMADFESAVTGAAGRHRVRVIKTIGDEAMLAAEDPSAVCRAAVDLVDYCHRHAVFESARAGVAFGEVLDQTGDCFGPTVNRAARLVEAAADDSVMVDLHVVDRLDPDLPFETRPTQVHRGIGEVPWARVMPTG